MSQSEIEWRERRTMISALERVIQAQREMNDFCQILPPMDSFPSIVTMLSNLARRHRLKIPEITYQNEQVKNQQLNRILVSFGVLGSYSNIRSFIRAVEDADRFLNIEDLDLLKSGKNPKDPIQFQLQVAVYLKRSNPETGPVM